MILVTFVVIVTLPPEGWGGRVAAVAVAGVTAVIALTSSDVRLARVRLAVGVGRGGGRRGCCSRRLCPRTSLLGIAFIVDALLLTVAALTILRRVMLASEVEFRTILGAISVFTLLGLLFGYLFLALGNAEAARFFAGCPHARGSATTSSSATRR